MKKLIEIYTDGACSGNQFRNNTGGWGAILISPGKRKKRYSVERKGYDKQQNGIDRMHHGLCVN